MIAEATMVVQKKYKSPDLKVGAACRFMELNDKIGIKTYPCEEDCDNCYSRQQYANRFGIAPAVIGEKFKVTVLKGGGFFSWSENRYISRVYVETYYCFLTEIVDIHCDIPGYHRLDTYHYIQTVRDMMIEIGMKPSDLHDGNYGWRKDGIVVTDFSHFDDDNDDSSDE